MEDDQSTKRFDDAFRRVQEKGLTWLPWVGQRFADRPPQKRLLIVGESHYYAGDTPESRQAAYEGYIEDPQSTRAQVHECLIHHCWEGGNKTLDTIPKLLFKTTAVDHLRLWSETAYFNLVQRPMDGATKERPSAVDFLLGWKVFSEVVELMQPSHCLFIGVSAANFFPFGGVIRTRKVGKTWARTAKHDVMGRMCQLIFVQHLGSYFSWPRWHDYLRDDHKDLMHWLESERYVTN